MRKQIDWNRYVPLGMDSQRTKNWLTALVGVGAGCSMTFLVDYFAARSDLFTYHDWKPVLIPGNMMVPFETLIADRFDPMQVVAAGMVLIAVLMYFYHYQGCRSIYTMKRLPNRWELWRRCLTLPMTFLVICGLATAALTGIYYLIWRFCTPAVCLPL